MEAGGRLVYPAMLKSTAGGGGIGLIRYNDAADLPAVYETAQRLALNFFSDAGASLERCIDDASCVDVQILGDGQGRVIALGARDCLLQRRNQQVVEETSAPDCRPRPGRASWPSPRRWAPGSAIARPARSSSSTTARNEFLFLEVSPPRRVAAGRHRH